MVKRFCSPFFIVTIVYSLSVFFSLAYSEEKITLAVLDFRNLTQEARLEYLEKAIPEVLITGLSVSDAITVVERSRLDEIINELELAQTGLLEVDDAREIGKLTSASAVLMGSITGSGDRYRIDSRLVEMETAEVILAEKRSWMDENEIIEQVDGLAEAIIYKLTGHRIPIGDTGFPITPVVTGQSVAMEAAVSNPYYLTGSEDPLYLLVDLYASSAVSEESRVPLNISLVIDRSGSMESEDKLNYVKEAAGFVVNHLGSNDILSLITYESTVQIPITAQHVDRKEVFLQRIRNIRSGGSTNLSGGMLEGYHQVSRNRNEGQVNRVLLLSDGLANMGITDPVRLKSICREKAGEGISISTFGVGAHYNEDLMLGLAEYGNGNYYFIDSPEKIPGIFSRELMGLLTVVAQNVAIEVKLPEEISVEEVYGYLYTIQDNTISIRLGDIFSGEQRSVLFRLGVPDSMEENTVSGSVYLRFDPASGDFKRVAKHAQWSMRYTDNGTLVQQNINRTVMETVNLLVSTQRMQEAIELVDQGDLQNAREQIRTESEAIRKAASEYQSTGLKKQMLNLIRYEQMLSDYENMESSEQRMLQKSTKYEMYRVEKKKD